MRAYGFNRRDKLSCKYGCCTGFAGKEKNCRKKSDAEAKKAARLEAKRFIAEEVDD